MSKCWAMVLACAVWMGCEKSSTAQAPPSPPAAAKPALPSGDPATLPKVPPTEQGILQMLRERFGADAVRTLRVEVDDRSGGTRVRLDGEVPTEEFRQAMMKEVEVRVQGLRISDFDLTVAGPIPMLARFDAPVHNQNSVAFSPDLSLAVTLRGEIYETATGRRINRLAINRLEEMYSAAFSPDGKVLASGHARGAILLWDMPSGTTHKVLSPPDPQAYLARVFALQFTADGKSLVSIDERRGQLMVWDLSSGQARLIGTHAPETNPSLTGPFVLAISPDGKTIASASTLDRGIILWDVASRSRRDQLDAELFYPNAAAWSRDGKYLAVARFNQPGSGAFLVWDLATKQPKVFPSDSPMNIEALAFTDDGKTLAARYEGQMLRLWDLSTGQKWQEIGRDSVGSGPGMAFSRDGTVLATECSSLKPPGVRLWDVSGRPGASGGGAKLPRTWEQVATRDDALATEIAERIRGQVDRRNIAALDAQVLPDGTVKLTGKVSSQRVKEDAERTAAIQGVRGEIVHTPRKVINEIEVTGQYGQ